MELQYFSYAQIDARPCFLLREEIYAASHCHCIKRYILLMCTKNQFKMWKNLFQTMKAKVIFCKVRAHGAKWFFEKYFWLPWPALVVTRRTLQQASSSSKFFCWVCLCFVFGYLWLPIMAVKQTKHWMCHHYHDSYYVCLSVANFIFELRRFVFVVTTLFCCWWSDAAISLLPYASQ